MGSRFSFVVLFLAVFATSCVHHYSECVADAGDANSEDTGDELVTVEPLIQTPEIVSGTWTPSESKAGDWPFGNHRASDLASDASKRAFDIEALYQVKNISSPVWSPDGRTILFNVVTSDLKKGKSNVEIYRIDANGKGLRRLTRFEGPDYAPVWAPDGKSFIFVSTRNEGAQLWQMALDGGEPQQITHISTGVDSPVWSNDGKLIAFASTVYPEYGADDAKNKERMDDAQNSPTQAHMADELLYRHWTSWADGTRTHILVLNVETKKIIDVTPGDFDSPVFSLGGHGFVFSPDSKELCFTSNREKGSAQAWTTNADLFVVPAAGGNTVNLTAENKAFDGEPEYSPDGRFIAFARQEIPGYESDRFRISIYDRKKGSIKILTQPFNDQIHGFKWTADSKSIIFQAAIKGRFPLLKLNIETGQIKRIEHIPSVREYDINDEGKLSFTYYSISDPLELFVGDIKEKSTSTRITAFNRELVEKYDIRPVEEMWIDGPAGQKIHTFIVKPHGFEKGKKYPLILNVHGGPQYQWADTFRGDWQVYPAAGYIVAFPNPTGSTGYSSEYTANISKDLGGMVFKEVMAVADALEKLDYVDKDKMGAMGWSYGGYMMNWIMGQTDRFKAIVSMMGIYDLPSFYESTEELWFPEWDVGGTPWDNKEAYEKHNPSNYAKNFKTPTLVISGEKDFRIPFIQSLQLFTALRRQDVPARLIIFPNDGHWPNWEKSMPLYYAAHLDWFHKYLGGGPSTIDVKKLVKGRAFK